MSTIHRLARRGDAEGLRTVLGESPDPRALANEVDDAGWTPLYYAVAGETPSIEAARLLLEAGADPAYVRVEVHPAMSPEDQERMRDVMRETIGESFDESEPLFSSEDSEYRESLLSGALKVGDLGIVRLLREHGADLTSRDENGYNAILHAVYGVEERPDLIRYLLDLGIDPSAETTYAETPLTTAYRFGQWRVVADLLAAGADPAPLAWTPLHRAVAIGTEAETLAALGAPDDLRAYDRWRRTPLHLALFRGDAARAALLVAHGADPTQPAEDGASTLAVAAEGGHAEAVALALTWDVPAATVDAALHVAVEYGHHAAAETLLRAGGEPEWQGEEIYPTLEQANDPEMVRLLLRHGADPSSLKGEGRRLLLGLPERDPEALEGVTREAYLAARHPREGAANPEDLTDPFRIAMVRAGVNAWRARETFGDPAAFACGIDGRSEPPVWCFDRFGVSTTILPDGRIVLVAGEHEDYYDPDFCIYNDVAVFSPDGAIALYGYPYSVFPPTDHHSATLVGGWIYLVGSLGYGGTREGPIPVARLNVEGFGIEPLATSGDVLGRIFDHRARLVGESTLRISGGTAITFADGEESHDPNPHAYDLDLRTLVWTRATPELPQTPDVPETSAG